MGVEADISELPKSAAYKAFVVRDGSVLAVRKGAGDMYYAGQWDLPGGSAEAGESEIEALKREVWEATGLTVGVAPEPFADTDFVHPPKTPKHAVHVAAYLAAVDDSVPPADQQSEYIDKVQWVAFEDLAETKFIPVLRPLIDAFSAQFVVKNDEVAA